MDRLTENYYDEFGIKHTKLKDNIDVKTFRSYTFSPQEIANEKLAELEDFMEKHKCHSVGDLMLEFTISAVDKLNLKLTEEKLSEMKAKLEESENLYKDLGFKDEKDARDYLIDCITQPKDLVKDVRQLKQQLAEEKNRNKKLNHEAQKYYKDAYCNGFQNQTAIAELEKVKQEFNGAFSISIQQEIFDKYIDQQIKSLKGE